MGIDPARGRVACFFHFFAAGIFLRQGELMRKFIATMSYELHSSTQPDARKLLRAELVGRRWQDRCQDMPMPAGTVWIRRSAEDEHNTDDVHDACVKDLHAAVAAVAATGRPIRLVRAFIHVSGGGGFGMVKDLAPRDPGTDAAPSGSTADDKAR